MQRPVEDRRWEKILRKCERKFIDNFDPLVYYGISKGVLKPPRGQSSGNYAVNYLQVVTNKLHTTYK